jgi:ABC-2 type transport system permease protein
MMWSVVKKELRGYFNSAIAVIFLAAFLGVALYTFFWREHFFARGLADLRPLFEWLPRLLIIIVSALAMRLWADERRAGTLEVLLTLPVPRWQLVLGKFIAGLALIGVALVLTLGLPLTIAHMGNLDWGPVLGGYLAALLVSAAYLSIGMCVSAATDNQIVAFVGTALACAIAYTFGGMGARFESVARGVLDLRDLAYYAAVFVAGVGVNVLLLERVRGKPRSIIAVGLVVANAVALNLWLQPVRRARIDLTQDGTYSLSEPTERILAGLDEPLLIRGYFSAKTHPKLAPLIPQIEDLLDEYRIAGHGKVRVEFVDPSDSDAAKREAKERFGIDPTPLRFANQNEKSVVNAYFAIAIAYGDQHVVLGLDDLISVRVVDVGDIEITLKNLEYQLTRSIKKSVAEFQSVDTLFASTPGKVQLTAYLTPKTLPDNWKDAPAKLKKVVDELAKQANGKLEFKQVEPQGDDQMKDLFERYGLRPYQDLMTGQVTYFHLLLQVGNRMVRIVPPQNLGEAELKASLIDGLKRAAPGFTRVVGLWTPPPAAPNAPMPGMPPRSAPPQTFESLRQALDGNYEVRDVSLAQPVPDDIETLVLAGPANLDDTAAEHVDQFVMRGGSLVVLAGRYRIAPREGLAVEKVTTGLEKMFEKWGITLGDEMVADEKSDVFPVPENRQLGNGLVVREIHQVPYPYFVRLDGDQLSEKSVITNGLAGSVMHWTTTVTAKNGTPLLTSSPKSWLTSATDVATPPKPTGKQASQVVAVSVMGGFDTSLSKKGVLVHSPPDTRIVVFGSSAFVSDDILALAQQLDSDFAQANLELVHNAVDWSLADTDLLAIRSRTAANRALTVAPDARDTWRTANIAIAAAGLLLVLAVAALRRRAITPITKEA